MAPFHPYAEKLQSLLREKAVSLVGSGSGINPSLIAVDYIGLSGALSPTAISTAIRSGPYGCALWPAPLLNLGIHPYIHLRLIHIKKVLFMPLC
jgi:hypothetical protein